MPSVTDASSSAARVMWTDGLPPTTAAQARTTLGNGSPDRPLKEVPRQSTRSAPSGTSRRTGSLLLRRKVMRHRHIKLLAVALILGITTAIALAASVHFNKA